MTIKHSHPIHLVFACIRRTRAFLSASSTRPSSLPDAEPHTVRPGCGGRKNQLLGAALSIAGLLAPAVGAEDAPAWAGTAKTAPAGLLDVALTKRQALFFTEQKVGGKVFPFLGFFIGADGLALCSLTPLSWKTGPAFKMGDQERTALPQPLVLAVFPEQELALVKFTYQPKTWLKLAKEPTPVGTWVTVLSPSFAPDPVVAPILVHRQMSWSSPLVPPRQPVKKFSFAAGRSPRIEMVFVKGAPLLDARGEVVAAFSGSQPLPGQTLRSASPLAELPERIQEAVTKAKPLKLPLSAEDLQLDPAVLSEESRAMEDAQAQGDFAKERQNAKALVAKFPDSHYARTEEFGSAAMGVDRGEVSAQELVELAKRFKIQDTDPPWARGAYYTRIGEALLRANRTDEAIASLQKADELWPQHMACMSLAIIFDKKGQLDEAERYWWRATSLDQERIEYWNRLSLVLSARLKFKEVSEVSDRARFLEDLYRVR